MASTNPAHATADEAAAQPALPESRFLRLPIDGRWSQPRLEEAIEWAARAGFNGLVAPVMANGLPLFPTDIPKRYGMRGRHPAFRRWDPMAALARAGRAAGLRFCGMAAPLWQAGGAIDPWAFGWMARRRAAWLAQPMRGAGQSASQPLCPSNAEWPRYLGDVFAEAADRYPIVGMIFESPCPLESPRGLAAPCLCERCRAEARARLDLDLEALARRAGPLDASALALCRDWARENARRVIEYLFLRCHKARRDMIFHFRLNDTPEAYALEDSAESTALRESQRHCETWLEEGAVDGVEIAGMPDDPEAFAEALERNLAVWPDDCLIYPVVRAATAEGFAALAAVMRERAVTGFVAEWAGPMTAETARTLAAGPLRAAAFISEREPIASVETLLEEVGMLSAADSGIAEFLRDLFRFTAHPEGMSPSEALAAAVENLRGLEARILQGQIDFGENAGMALLRLSQAKRLARLAANFSPA